MVAPKIGIVSFPGTNNEVESVRAIKRAGMEPVCLKWNDSHDRYGEMDGYFLVGGFSYEDRGRSGMVAARDPILSVLSEEASKGKVILGHCNGAQILVESGLIPLGRGLKMALARNAIRKGDTWESPGFLNEWVWIKPACAKNRCAPSGWEGLMHVPIAHGEGRFVTRDPDVIAELEKNDQIAFRYCDRNGAHSEEPSVVPNGSMHGIAGICNPGGNVVALMPHPERTVLGDPYFASVRRWIAETSTSGQETAAASPPSIRSLPLHERKSYEIFIAALITNNEERTVEQAAKRYVPSLSLRQYRYVGTDDEKRIGDILSSLSVFNANKETAYLRDREGTWFCWDASSKKREPLGSTPLKGVALLRKDLPDVGHTGISEKEESGICYVCTDADESAIVDHRTLEVFANSHASSLERFA